MALLIAIGIVLLLICFAAIWRYRGAYASYDEKPDDLRRAGDEPPKQPPSLMKWWSGKP